MNQNQRGFEVKVVEDSISHHGVRLTTLQLRYPRFIHAEFMTHRVFSRNASSSRAIPVAKMIEQVRTNPAMPIHWGKNQPGMQANGEIDHVPDAIAQWRYAASQAADRALEMTALGLHKQVANRILEPFQWISVVVTATEWENFFELRDHADAQPEIRYLAGMMRQAMDDSISVERARDRLVATSWHLPYVTTRERAQYHDNPTFLAKLSTARNARTSYLTHDGVRPDPEKDLGLFERLVGSRPLHSSPTEHVGYPLPAAEQWSRNLRGWRQYRELVEIEVAGATQ
ncbi:FAD-dependent thymidylate synthase [Cupriavidus basilensis]|uniref:FAD-dependent thymidylate synthase n=1 Tax=Cupriavidus basilensis TaxID=68895 RepID=UPI0020A63ACB|nr:FAD-dependent thymidylate synthase [Cupriavidus basilensis]MCP3017461.1 FAD-dependent thymidylate synthase [Cupriavidus basilensis]